MNCLARRNITVDVITARKTWQNFLHNIANEVEQAQYNEPKNVAKIITSYSKTAQKQLKSFRVNNVFSKFDAL